MRLMPTARRLSALVTAQAPVDSTVRQVAGVLAVWQPAGRRPTSRGPGICLAARDLAPAVGDVRPWLAAATGQQPGAMPAPEATSRQQADNDTAGPARRFVVVIGKPAYDGSVCRVDDPDRLLRIWSLLAATYEQSNWAALPPEVVPGLQRQLAVIRRELEAAVSAPLVAELRRILPPQDAAPSVGAMRIEYALLLSWAGSLMVEVLRSLAVVGERRSRREQPVNR